MSVRGPAPPSLPILNPRGPTEVPSENPWIVWQPLDRTDEFTCTRCGEKKTGLRYVELTGTEPRIWPVLPRNPAHLETVSSRIGRRVYCAECRHEQPKPQEAPKRKKRSLD